MSAGLGWWHADLVDRLDRALPECRSTEVGWARSLMAARVGLELDDPRLLEQLVLAAESVARYPGLSPAELEAAIAAEPGPPW